MPHLDSGPFVHDRMRSILAQTLRDWELITVDSQSGDGSLSVLEEYARADPRIHIHQAPRDGIYSNINRAIKLARGRYIYLATSDDTMEPECLDEMVAALEAHPECGLAHCCLAIIDEVGRPVSANDAWESYATQRYFGPWLQKAHVRRAPHDGLLHFRNFTVFTSLTQLLTRREVYDRLGLFPTNIGSHADFAWGLRVSLIESVVHVPRHLATWRRHGGQATKGDTLLRARARGEFGRIAAEALDWLGEREPELARKIRTQDLLRYYRTDEFRTRMRCAKSQSERAGVLLSFLLRRPVFFVGRMFRRPIGEIADDVRALMPDGGLVEAQSKAHERTPSSGDQFARNRFE